MAGKTRMSRYEFALKVSEVFGLDAGGIVGVPTSSLQSPARRPLEGGLLCGKAERELGITMPETLQSLRRMKEDREKYGIPG